MFTEATHECDWCKAIPEHCYCFAHLDENNQRIIMLKDDEIREAYNEGKADGYAEGLRAR